MAEEIADNVGIGINLLFLIPGEVGGTENHSCRLLMDLLDRYPEKRFVVFVNEEMKKILGGVPMGGYLPIEGQVKYVYCNVGARNRVLRVFYEQLILPFKVKKEKVDILWSWGNSGLFFLTGQKQWITVHDIQYKKHPENFSKRLRWILNILIWVSVRLCERIFSISEFTKQELIRWYGVDSSKVKVMSPFFLLSGLKEEGLEAGPIVEEGYILYVANYYTHKNHDLIFEILPKLKVKWVLVGRKSGQGYINFLREYSQLGEDDQKKVIFYENVSQDILRNLYKRCKAFVFLSQYEGFGIPIFEALYYKSIIIASDILTNREILGDACLYFQNNDAKGCLSQIEKVLSEDFSREEHIQKSKARLDILRRKFAGDFFGLDS